MAKFNANDEVVCYHNGGVEDALEVGARYVVSSYDQTDDTVFLCGVGHSWFTASRFHLALPVAQPSVEPQPSSKSVYERIKAGIEGFADEALEEYDQGYLDCYMDLMEEIFNVEVKTKFTFEPRKAA